MAAPTLSSSAFANPQQTIAAREQVSISSQSTDEAATDCALCMCKVCDCGKHHCKDTPRTTHYDPDLSSEARSRYRGTHAPPSESCAPKRSAFTSPAPFEGDSLYRSTFVPHDLSSARVQPAHDIHASQLPRSSAPFDGVSTHRADYVKHPLTARSRPSRDVFGSNAISGDDNRDFLSESRAQYTAKRAAPREARPQTAPPVSSGPFEGVSQYRASFRGTPASAAPNLKPVDSFIPSADDRNFDSEYSNFKAHQIEPCPAIPLAAEYRQLHRTGHAPLVPATPLDGRPRYRFRA